MKINYLPFITTKQLKEHFHFDWDLSSYKGMFVPLKLEYNEERAEDFQSNEAKRQINQLYLYLRAIGYDKDLIGVYVNDDL